AVPVLLEDAVRETQDEDVLDGLRAQGMVDAEHLVLAENDVDHLVERPCRLAVVAVRLLDDDARPARLTSETVLADRLDDRLVGGRRCREVEETVGVCAERKVELVERAPELLVSGVV